MRASRAAAALIAAVAVSVPAAAQRIVDYSQSDDQVAVDARELKVAPPAPLPSRGALAITIDNIEALDHRVAFRGIGCSAWETDNPLSQMVSRVLSAWDADGRFDSGNAADALAIRFEAATTIMRCVQTGEWQTKCLVRSNIRGMAKPSWGAATSFDVGSEIVIGGGDCGVARGAGLAGRAASVALVDRLSGLATR